jgi:hypothetical protein
LTAAMTSCVPYRPAHPVSFRLGEEGEWHCVSSLPIYIHTTLPLLVHTPGRILDEVSTTLVSIKISYNIFECFYRSYAGVVRVPIYGQGVQVGCCQTKRRHGDCFSQKLNE